MSQNDTLTNEASDEFASANGFRWESEEVSRRDGPNDSDKAIVNSRAQILVVTDLDLFVATFGKQYMLGMSDGTSTRVMCQRVGRKFRGNDVNANRLAVLGAVRGIRTRVATPPKHHLPDGSIYSGTDLAEFQRLYVAALVDSGCNADVALAIGAKQSL